MGVGLLGVERGDRRLLEHRPASRASRWRVLDLRESRLLTRNVVLPDELVEFRIGRLLPAVHQQIPITAATATTPPTSQPSGFFFDPEPAEFVCLKDLHFAPCPNGPRHTSPCRCAASSLWQRASRSATSCAVW